MTKKIIKKALELFEYHKPVNEDKNCDKCNQSIEKKSYYSFTMSAINGKSELYKAFSRVINDTDLSSNYTYKWANYALESINDALDDEATLQDLKDLELHEMVDSSVDVYTYDLTQWLGTVVFLITKYHLSLRIAAHGKDSGPQQFRPFY